MRCRSICLELEEDTEAEEDEDEDEDEETYEEEEEDEEGEEDEDDEVVTESSSLTLEEQVYQACTSPEALRMTSKQLMDEMFRKFNVRTKQLKEILGGVSVGTFLE